MGLKMTKCLREKFPSFPTLAWGCFQIPWEILRKLLALSAPSLAFERFGRALYFADWPMLVAKLSFKTKRLLIITLSLPLFFCLEIIVLLLEASQLSSCHWLSIGNEFILLAFHIIQVKVSSYCWIRQTKVKILMIWSSMKVMIVYSQKVSIIYQNCFLKFINFCFQTWTDFI